MRRPPRSIRSALLRAPALVGLLAALVACNPSLSPPQDRQVDGSLVSAAKLDPCPATVKGSVTGGLPKLTLPCLDGTGRIDLAGVRGPALVNLWYATCGPCQKEAPYLVQFRAAAKGKVALLGIDVDPYPDDGLHFAINYGVHYPSLSDQHDDAPSKFGSQGFPTTYFVDAAGHLVGPAQVTPFTSYADVVAAVRSHLHMAIS